MDKAQARGRAAKIVSMVLEGCIREGAVMETLLKHYDRREGELIQQEIQNISNELALQAEGQKKAERGK